MPHWSTSYDAALVKQRKGGGTSMRLCIGCGIQISNPKYCSNKCQQETIFKERTKLWLETGFAKINSQPTHYIRQFLLKEQNDECAICSLPSIWNEQPLVFILDHIDGNSENNKRENLRMVCPNCDSQLPTYKGRNAGNGRHSRRKRYASNQSY